MTDLEERIRRLEDREEIQQLAVRYGLAVDDRDYDGISDLFAPDGRLCTKAGACKGDGVSAVVAYFKGHLPTLGVTNHFVHGHVIDLDRTDPDHATGVVLSHAELWRNGAPMITAMRYLDSYCRVDGAWRFQERIQSYMYFVDVREYADVLGTQLRVRSSRENPQPADWPILAS